MINPMVLILRHVFRFETLASEGACPCLYRSRQQCFQVRHHGSKSGVGRVQRCLRGLEFSHDRIALLLNCITLFDGVFNVVSGPLYSLCGLVDFSVGRHLSLAEDTLHGLCSLALWLRGLGRLGHPESLSGEGFTFRGRKQSHSVLDEVDMAVHGCARQFCTIYPVVKRQVCRILDTQGRTFFPGVELIGG